jgi:ATP-dependent RNA helicase HelY
MDIDEFEGRYGFPLDSFQREALTRLEAGKSVLVAAPTGSGKTVIAEYALEMARAQGLKCFYTAPIKALSNQKYRDLTRAYSQQEVGLLTGDNSINNEAPLVVMTTEVLRNMIYEGSELLDSLGVVVLDEVHYMQDPYRGGVWEEIVILLSHGVRVVGLSATVSNAHEIGDWMNSIRGGVEVVTSSERPVQLKNHYFVGRALVPLFSKSLARVINEQIEIEKKASTGRERGRRRRPGTFLRPRRTDVVDELLRRDMLPAIYFLFSRAACSDSVSMWLNRGPLTSAAEREEISGYIDEKVSPVDPDDLECLDYARFRKALLAGVAAHHAGMLPLFKESVEELFSRGLVKVVFATETLSLGINMPARTVVIESLSKWDGDRHRPMTPGEYKQLTGRAGRRGIDVTGYAVVLHQGYFSVDQVRALVSREPNPVVSSFEVSYNMAVNLLAGHDLTESRRLLNLSFAQYAADKRVTTLEARLEFLERELDSAIKASHCEEADARQYRELERAHSRLTRRLATIGKERRRRETREAMVRLQPGDVFLLKHSGEQKVLAVVRKRGGRKDPGGVLVVDPNGRYRRLSPESMEHPPRIVGAVDVSKITSPTRKVRRSAGERMEALQRKAKGPPETAGPGGEEERLSRDAALVKEEMEAHPCRSCSHNLRCMDAARKAEKTAKRIDAAVRERDSGHEVVSRRLLDVIDLLNELGFMEGESLTARGETLRGIYNECDLLLVEALEEGVASELDPPELASFVSWFIYESREADDEDARQGVSGPREHIEGNLEVALEKVETILTRVKEAESRRGLDLLGSVDTGFSEAAFLWANGAELEEMLARFPDRSVGDMVRVMKQMIDLMRQMADAAGDPALAGNLRRAMDFIDRGVVGYSSLESIIEHEGAG